MCQFRKSDNRNQRSGVLGRGGEEDKGEGEKKEVNEGGWRGEEEEEEDLEIFKTQLFRTAFNV